MASVDEGLEATVTLRTRRRGREVLLVTEGPLVMKAGTRGSGLPEYRWRQPATEAAIANRESSWAQVRGWGGVIGCGEGDGEDERGRGLL